MSYQLKPRGVRRLIDEAFIPNEPANADWREFEQWVAQGNTPLPDDPAPAAIDCADADTLEKTIKATLLACAAMSGRTPAQARAAFRTAWQSLP